MREDFLRPASAFAGFIVVALMPFAAVAQDSDAADNAAQQAPAVQAAQAEAAAPATQNARMQTTVLAPPGYPSPGANLESHLGSSSRALSDISQGDTFDFEPPGSKQLPLVRGRAGALGAFQPEGGSSRGAPGAHTVRPGETLSSVSQQLFGQPWAWPKLWALNPQIQNPHWIYPGDQIRLSAPPEQRRRSRSVQTLGSGQAPSTGPAVPENTVFLRRLGYIDDPAKGVIGEVVGAKQPIQLMSQSQAVYLVLRPGQTVLPEQELTIFRPTRTPPEVRGARKPPGMIVALKGTVRVDYFNPKTRVVRGVITESLDVIERGAKVGVVNRQFELVPPKKTTENIATRIITSMYPHAIMGQQQVVFLDRGAKDGLEPGNRMFVIRRGDTWRRTFGTVNAMARSRIAMDVEESLVIEDTPIHGNEQEFPEEIVGELRVVETHPYSCLALVTESRVALEPGDRAVARSGF